jgi:hypothetical protein
MAHTPSMQAAFLPMHGFAMQLATTPVHDGMTVPFGSDRQLQTLHMFRSR